jgi:hypothetical protein
MISDLCGLRLAAATEFDLAAWARISGAAAFYGPVGAMTMMVRPRRTG